MYSHGNQLIYLDVFKTDYFGGLAVNHCSRLIIKICNIGGSILLIMINGVTCVNLIYISYNCH